MSADDLIKAMLEGRRTPAFAGGISGEAGEHILWNNPKGSRIDRGYQNAEARGLAKPSGDNSVFKPSTRSDESYRTHLHHHVVRRMLKYGVLKRDGADYVPGPHAAHYHKTLETGIGGNAFLSAHDAGQHAVIGVRGDWPGEYHVGHMGKLMGHLKTHGRITADQMQNFKETAHIPSEDSR